MAALKRSVEAQLAGEPSATAASSPADGVAPRAGVLTARETEVLGLLAGGKTNREIADQLVLSVRTVEQHVANVYGQVGARNRAQATTYAIRVGLA